MKYQEKFIRGKKVYSGRAVDFHTDTVMLPDGKKAVREYTVHPGAAAAVAGLPGGRIILVRQYRYPLKKTMLEVPAGKLAPREAPLHCIKRELAEETGYAAGRFIRLGKFHPTCAFSTEVIHLFAALNLKKSQLRPDDDEFIEPVILKFSEALNMVKNGKITDAKTVISLLFWKNLQAGR